MSYQSVVEKVKGRVETLVAKSEHAAKISGGTVRQASTIVADSFKILVKDQTAVAKDFYTSAKSGIEKAKADGITAVVKKPVAYLPATDKFKAALHESMSHLGVTGDKVFKTMKSGASDIRSQFKAEPKVVTATKATVKKAKTKVAIIRRKTKAAL